MVIVWLLSCWFVCWYCELMKDVVVDSLVLVLDGDGVKLILFELVVLCCSVYCLCLL